MAVFTEYSYHYEYFLIFVKCLICCDIIDKQENSTNYIIRGISMTKLLKFKGLVILVLVIFSFTLISCSNSTTVENPVNTTANDNNQESDFKLVFKELQSEIEKDRAMGVIQRLTDVSPRVAGTDDEVAAAQYVLKEFNKLGFTSTLEEFPMKSFKANEWNLTIHYGNETLQLDSSCLSFSSSTPDGGLENIPLVYGSYGQMSDVHSIDMEGKIAVVSRGKTTFREMAINCDRKGALGVIIINSEDTPLKATLVEKSPIPAVSVSQSDGMKIMNEIKNESLRANLLVDTTIEDSISNNVIGVKESSNKDAKTLIIGAHYDSVDCPGANDNASGVAGLMELAYILEDSNLPFNIHFIAFGSEEIGLIGSNYNVRKNYYKSKDVIGMINMDMIGMGEHLEILREKKYSDATFYDLASSAAKELNIEAVETYGGRSDHVSFESARIPVVFLTYAPHDPMYYHTDLDTIDTIDSSLLKNTVEVVLKMITELANE